MRIAILSRRSTLYTTRRFVKTARTLGHTALVLDPMRCVLHVRRHRHAIHYNDRELKMPDVVLPRIGAISHGHSLGVLQQFEARGVRTINSSLAISRTRDKLRSLQFLVERSVPIAPTVMTHDPARLERAIDLVGGPPVVLKLLQGTQGIGVILADSYETARSTLSAFWRLGQNILIQQYMGKAPGRDTRALVLGGRIVAAMRRIARDGDFRCNIHRGAEGEPAELSAAETDVAIRAAAAMGLELAGVDLLEGDDGPVVMEVNSSPGFEGLEAVTRLDVARAIVEYAIETSGGAREPVMVRSL